jgi:hypothetical protein
MEFLKKNYEKIVLVVVLLGLTAASCLLPIIISEKRKALEEKRTNTKARVTPLPAPDMTMENAALQRVQSQLHLDFTNKHNLLNPVLWKRFSDGRLSKSTGAVEEGVGALQVTGIKPLYLIITYDSPSGNGYLITIEQQTELTEAKRHSQRFVSKESKSELLALQEVKGPADKPTELDFIWNENGNTIALTPDKPYKEVSGYSADLKYPPEPNKVWLDRRVGSRDLLFAGGSYKIVAITESNVVMLAESNKKKTTITLHSATEPR